MKIVNRHTHTHTQRKDENIIPPWHTSYAGVINMSQLLTSSVRSVIALNEISMQYTGILKTMNTIFLWLYDGVFSF